MPDLVFAKEVGCLRYVSRALWWRLRTAVLRQELSFVLPTGLEFPLPKDSAFARRVFVTRANVDWNAEYVLAKHLQEQEREGDFFDVGANAGYHTALLSPLVRRTYAFEPDPRCFGWLSAVAVGAGNARLVRQAAADFSGAGTLADGMGELELTTLDDFCRTHAEAAPLAVRVAVGGLEQRVLKGALRLARQFQPVFFVRFQPGAEAVHGEAEQLRRFLDVARYALYAGYRKEQALGFRYEFRRLEAGDLPGLMTKMLFLAPAGNDFFEKLAAETPPLLRRLMRPPQIHDFLNRPLY